MRAIGKSLGFNISSAAAQRMPTSAAFILQRVESLLLRQSVSAFLSVPLIVAGTLILRLACGVLGLYLASILGIMETLHKFSRSNWEVHFGRLRVIRYL
jgi:hypothetical protein